MNAGIITIICAVIGSSALTEAAQMLSGYTAYGAGRKVHRQHP